MQQLRILYRDEYMVIVEKPPGLQVHPPESGGRVRVTALSLLKHQMGQWVYPVHRLDRATSGVLMFAFSSEIAAELQALFKSEKIWKTYVCVCRGWLEPKFTVESPLKTALGDLVSAKTHFDVVSRFEMPFPAAGFSRSRYSLVKAMPVTGRFHQIRRHLKHISHPMIGDSVYGDGKHNRYWREVLGAKILLLRAYSLQFIHPRTREPIYIYSRWPRIWHELFDRVGVCPFLMERAIT